MNAYLNINKILMNALFDIIYLLMNA